MKNRSAENFLILVICLGIMLIFSVVLFLQNYLLGIIEFIFFVLLTAVMIMSVRKKHGNFTNYIEDITFHVDNATKESLVYAPMPVIVIKDNGKILWYNKFFDTLCGDVELFDNEITTVIGDLDINALFQENEISFETTLYNKRYRVLGNSLKVEKRADDATIAVIYLLDIDEYYNYKVKYDEDMPVVGVLSIDNYDEVLSNTPDTYRSLLVAEIENRIYSWISFSECIIKKFERDKYIIFLKRKHLQSLVEDKFSILDKVKEIKCGNKFSATLSIGIGINGETYHSADEYATSALTLALGRGGDQVVIKSFENVAYYGGKSREHEKTTKVKARVTALAIKELLAHSSNVVVMGHKFPDMDCVGAAIGVCAFAKSVGVKANLIYDGSSEQINNILKEISNHIDYDGVVVTKQEAAGLIKSDTLLVVVDTHRPSYTEVPELLNNKNNIVLIDHHRRAADFIENASLVYHEPYASSTCEMIAELLQYIGDDLEFSSVEAEALYSGMLLDTKQFTSKTGVRTFEAAAFLKRNGVDVNKVRNYFKNDFKNIVKIANIISTAEIYRSNIAISVYEEVSNSYDRTIAPQAADKLLQITNIETSFVLSDLGEEIAINGRSSGNMNVQVILEKLGGGGHQNVAGVQVPKTSFEEVITDLKYAIDEYINEQQN